MGDDIGLGLSSMAICFDFCSSNIVQHSNQNPYFYRFQYYHPLMTQFTLSKRLTAHNNWSETLLCTLHGEYHKLIRCLETWYKKEHKKHQLWSQSKYKDLIEQSRCCWISNRRTNLIALKIVFEPSLQLKLSSNLNCFSRQHFMKPW